MSDNKYETDYAHHSRKQVMPAAGSLFRWLIAALVTVNGGALIALTQQADDNFAFLRASGTYFGAGLLFVILGGLLGFIGLFWLGGLIDAPEAAAKKDYKSPSELTVWTLLTLGIIALTLPIMSLTAFGMGGMKLIDTVEVKAAEDAAIKAKLKKAPLCRPTPVTAPATVGKPV